MPLRRDNRANTDTDYKLLKRGAQIYSLRASRTRMAATPGGNAPWASRVMTAAAGRSWRRRSLSSRRHDVESFDMMSHTDGGGCGSIGGRSPKGAAGGIGGGERECLVEFECAVEIHTFLNASRNCFHFISITSSVSTRRWLPPPYRGDGGRDKRRR